MGDQIKMADKPKEKTEEEKQAELATERCKIAKKNLESSLWNYAAPKFITSEGYGKLSQGSQALYGQIISKSPEQGVYEQLFLPQLAKEGGAITSAYIQNTSAQILQESLASVKVEDAIKYFGVKGALKSEYAGKYVNQLDKETAQMIIGSAITYKTDELVKGILNLRQKEFSKELSDLLIEPEKKDSEGKKNGGK